MSTRGRFARLLARGPSGRCWPRNCCTGALGSTLFHQVAYVQDKGFDIREAALVATMVAGFAIPSKLVYGFLAERFAARWVLAAAMIPAGLSVLLLVMGGSREALLAYGVCYGFTMGGYIPMINVALAQYFGRQHMGAIRGVATPVATVTGRYHPVRYRLNVAAAWQLRCSVYVAGGGLVHRRTVRAGGKAAEGAVGRGRDEAALSLTG